MVSPYLKHHRFGFDSFVGLGLFTGRLSTVVFHLEDPQPTAASTTANNTHATIDACPRASHFILCIYITFFLFVTIHPITVI